MRNRTTGKYKEPIIITIYIEKSEVEKIDEYCLKIKKSRSRFLIDSAIQKINQ